MVQYQGHKCAYGLEGSDFALLELAPQPVCSYHHNLPDSMRDQLLQPIDKPVDVLPGLWRGDPLSQILIRLLLSLGSL